MKRRTFIKTTAVTAIAATLPFAAQAAQTHQVTIEGFAFSPASLAVNDGDTIIFTNADSAPHTASADDGSWDTGRLNRGQSGEIAVTANMASAYHCNFHRNMRAVLTGV